MVVLLRILTPGLTPCAAQTKPRIQHFNVEDGLSQSSVYSVFQDSYGFIWMATGDGLNRFDGKDFISYKSKLADVNRGLLKDRNINSVIFEDCCHNLWFTADEGLYCMNRHTGQTDIYLNKNVVGYSGVIVGVDSSDVWLYVAGRGICKVNAHNKAVSMYPFSDSIQRKSATPMTHGLSDGDAIWMVDARGILKWSKQSKKDERVLLRTNLRRLCRVGGGKLAASAEGGIFVSDKHRRQWQFMKLETPGRSNVTFGAIIWDSISNNLYVAEHEGGTILKVDLATGRQELLNFQSNRVVRMFVDGSQNLWVGTDGGGAYVLDIKPPKFYCYMPAAGGNSGAMVKSLYRADNGDIWMGLYGKGLARYNPISSREDLLLQRAAQNVYFSCTFRDSAGDIVVAMNDRIAWLDERTGRIKAECVLPYYPFMGPVPPEAFAIVEWRKGVYLVGANYGLYYVNKTGGMPHATHIRRFSMPGLGGWVYGMYRSGESLYIGRRNGYSKVRLSRDTIPEIQELGLNDMPVRHFYRSTITPLVWIASEQGLIAHDEQTRRYTVFDEDDGMANSFVYAILPQNDSTLWVSTNKGITRVNVRYRPGNEVDATFTNYTAKDGLQSNEFNSGAYFACDDGTLMFGGIAGINWFKPEGVVPNRYMAQPAITGIYVDDALLTRDTAIFTHKLVLPYRRNTVSLTFRALEYTLPEQNRYAYKLEGQDNQWVYTANDRVRFPKLEPGEYKFLLKVSNNEGVWNEKPLELEIVIMPPYWRTWWFRLLVVMSGALLLAVILRYYTRQRIRARTLELEKKYALDMERLRISKDVHDDIGSGLSRISLLSELASRKMSDDEQAVRDVQSISSLSKELVDNMHDLIWVLNPENTTLDSLVSRLREYCADYLEGVGIAVTLDFPGDVPGIGISREVQRNIFSTVKEAVNNSVKHARAKSVTVSVNTQDRLLTVIVRDDGVGFDTHSVRSLGNGLRNMRYRIESVGGTFDVQSEPGKGTVIKVQMTFSGLHPEWR